ncbi:transformer-2 protein homolog beta [Cyclospora cayetanensis]|uniref:Uncharacterized protein n=2 Tax=Cyclospora cayetanensis TaxID=88456 RepID=A0A1D3CZC1_9EIME|nr:transformer-2 protein homolog beta [Cyclospora cayetanensis]OEH76555.1 hypothetical protein cyc_07520 [Cyclospora cayetanensis]
MSEGRMESEERERRDEEMIARERGKRGGSHGASEGNLGGQEEEHRDLSNTRRASASSSRVDESLQQGNRDRNDAGDECNGSERRFGSQRRSGSGARPRQRGGDTDTLYISNLPLRCGALELRRIFEEVGEVQDCRIVNNPVSRESRGFAFLSFVDPSRAAVAIERFDNKFIFGEEFRPVRVERAKRNKPHNPTPGFYKGPPGASIKYDKSGRLKPGFLPYYAVAPGASRDFIPPHPFGMEFGSGARGHSGGRWADERGWSARGGYDSGGRYYDRMEYSAHGRPPMDFRGANPGDFPYDMRMERGYDMRPSRGSGYDTRGGPPYERGAPMYDARGYDRGGYEGKWQQYDDTRGDGRYVGYCDYYGGNGASGAAYDINPRVDSRDVKAVGRERSRSRGRRERRRSASPERHHRAGRR